MLIQDTRSHHHGINLLEGNCSNPKEHFKRTGTMEGKKKHIQKHIEKQKHEKHDKTNTTCSIGIKFKIPEL